MHPDAWLVVIDPQRIFASPGQPVGLARCSPASSSPYAASPSAAGERTVVTRWVPAPDPQGSWAAYLEAWPFADVAEGDPLLVAGPRDGRHRERTSSRCRPSASGGRHSRPITGPTPHLVLAGVSTDCCVVSTALAAADAGATITVVTDACAGSTPENHRSALDVMALYPPQITLATAAEVLWQAPVSRVIHTGQALVDVVVEVPDLPARGQNVMATSATDYAGGAVAGVVAAARFGAACVHAGAHGTGPHGDLVRTALDAEGISASAPPVADRDTGICVVMVEPSAERTFVTTLGAERQISVVVAGHVRARGRATWSA